MGHPDIYIGVELVSAGPVEEWFGVARVQILAPKDLYIPVLPIRVGEKLLFHLCTACANQLQNDFCNHEDKDRIIHGTFFTEELLLAIRKGYKLIKTFELWHWPKSRQTMEMFKDFIAPQYLRKATASKLPQTQVEDYIDYLNTTFGDGDISLGSFKLDPTERTLAKLVLNSIWGYLGRRGDNVKTDIVLNPGQLDAIDAKKDVEITNVSIMADPDMLLVEYKPILEEPLAKQSLILALMTTGYARIALYKILDEYSHYTLYFDTDSVFLYLPDSVAPPVCSNKLGELKDEVLDAYGPGARIVHFMSTGPKSYQYRLAFIVLVLRKLSQTHCSVERDGMIVDEVTKMKGISADAETGRRLRAEFATLMKNVEDREFFLEFPQHQIRRNFKQSAIWNHTMPKKIRFHSTKRWLPDFTDAHLASIPYGFSRDAYIQLLRDFQLEEQLCV